MISSKPASEIEDSRNVFPPKSHKDSITLLEILQHKYLQSANLHSAKIFLCSTFINVIHFLKESNKYRTSMLSFQHRNNLALLNSTTIFNPLAIYCLQVFHLKQKTPERRVHRRATRIAWLC